MTVNAMFAIQAARRSAAIRRDGPRGHRQTLLPDQRGFLVLVIRQGREPRHVWSAINRGEERTNVLLLGIGEVLAFLERLDPEDIRLRVFHSRRSIEHSELARLTQIDYAREMAFVATRPVPDDGEETLGAVRVVVDPDNIEAEFGVIVRSDLKGAGIGSRLMRKMIEHLRARGTQRMVCSVLRENAAMLELARHLGFQEDKPADDPDNQHLRIVSLQLSQTPGA